MDIDETSINSLNNTTPYFQTIQTNPLTKNDTPRKEFGPWVTFMVSVLAMLTAGSLFAFSSFSEPLRIALGYSAQDINMISAFGNTASYISFLFIGPFFDKFGEFRSMVISTLLYCGGYLFMYLTYEQKIPGNVWSMVFILSIHTIYSLH